jgi:hypothetical protein
VITQLQVVLGESNEVIRNEDLFAIKFGSPLFSKLKMEYWLSVPKTRFSWDHGHLSRPVPSRGMPRPGGGLRVAVSADAVEQRQRHG